MRSAPLSISSTATLATVTGSDLPSRLTNSTGLPSRPPPSFSTLTATCAPLKPGVSSGACTPVNDSAPPKMILSSWAIAALPARSTPAKAPNKAVVDVLMPVSLFDARFAPSGLQANPPAFAGNLLNQGVRRDLPAIALDRLEALLVPLGAVGCAGVGHQRHQIAKVAGVAH